MTNISIAEDSVQEVSRLLMLIGQPARVQILMVISSQEACVCHIEAVLGMRQASISQHLMVLRKAGLVATQREGRNIFYRLGRPEVVGVLQQAAQLAGILPDTFQALTLRPVPGCTCPQCNPDLDPELTCKSSKSACSS